jgi:hypothetical protein
MPWQIVRGEFVMVGVTATCHIPESAHRSGIPSLNRFGESLSLRPVYTNLEKA